VRDQRLIQREARVQGLGRALILQQQRQQLGSTCAQIFGASSWDHDFPFLAAAAAVDLPYPALTFLAPFLPLPFVVAAAGAETEEAVMEEVVVREGLLQYGRPQLSPPEPGQGELYEGIRGSWSTTSALAQPQESLHKPKPKKKGSC